MSISAQALPVAQPRSRDWVTPVELLLLGAIWGASFLFMRIAAPEFGAAALVEIRLGLGGLALLPALWLARQAFSLRQWPLLAGIGLINTAVPFALFAWAAERAPAGVGAITNSLAVLFTALMAFLIWGERIGGRRAIALFAGFVGVLVLAAGKTAGASVTAAALAGSLAALCYGIGANLVRRKLAGMPPVAVAAATLLSAAVLFAPWALSQWPSQAISLRAWGSAMALGLVCTGVAYAFYFRLIRRIGAPRAVTVTYLVPLFGVGWAWLVLGEMPNWNMAVAGGLILGSVALSQTQR